jgi:hypothetical protein
MLLKSLREEVLQANLELVRRGLVLYTSDIASGISVGKSGRGASNCVSDDFSQGSVGSRGR